MSKMTGLLVAGGVFGAVAASALATSVAPAPAQALDACFSSGLTGTLGTGSASCSSSGPSQWAIAIGANTSAEVGGGLFNLAIAVGDNSRALTTGDGGSYFNIATAVAGGFARASDGIFQIAAARGSQTDFESGAVAADGSFGVARAIGVNAFAQVGAYGDLAQASAFNIAGARGENSTAFARNGFGNSSRAFGSGAIAIDVFGNGNIARALGTVAVAEIGRGSFNIARAVGSNSVASAGLDSGVPEVSWSMFNIASVIGNGSIAATFEGNRNTARVFGNNSHAAAGPGIGRRAIIVGSGKTKSDPPPGASARRAAASVRSAPQR
jgi:hypothetical protein